MVLLAAPIAYLATFWWTKFPHKCAPYNPLMTLQFPRKFSRKPETASDFFFHEDFLPLKLCTNLNSALFLAPSSTICSAKGRHRLVNSVTIFPRFVYWHDICHLSICWVILCLLSAALQIYAGPLWRGRTAAAGGPLLTLSSTLKIGRHHHGHGAS